MNTKKKVFVLVSLMLVLLAIASVITVVSAEKPAEVTVEGGDTATVEGADVVWPTERFDDGSHWRQTAADPEAVDFMNSQNAQSAAYKLAPFIEFNSSCNSLNNEKRIIMSRAVYNPNSGYWELEKLGNMYFDTKTAYTDTLSKHTVRITYGNLDCFLAGGGELSLANGDAQVIQITPVLRKMAGSDGDFVVYDTLETLAIMHLGDTYYTEYTYNDGDLENGVYNISFVVTYLDAFGNHVAFILDADENGVISRIDNRYIGLADYSDSQVNVLDESGEFPIAYRFYTGRAVSDGNSENQFHVDADGMISFRVTAEDKVLPKYSVTGGRYEYGCFDASVITYQKGNDAATTLPLFDMKASETGVLNNGVISYRLYRLTTQGGKTYRIPVCYDGGSGSVAGEFYTIKVLNDLNVGNYEIEVLFDGFSYTSGGQTLYKDASIATGKFTVAPKTVTLESRDIFVLISEYDEEGVITNEKDVTDLFDARAYYDAYAKRTAAEAKAMYEALAVEYAKVTKAYEEAETAYETVMKYQPHSFAYEFGDQLTVSAWCRKSTGTYSTGNLLLCYEGVLLDETQIFVQTVTPPFAGSRLEKAYDAYCAYVKAYKEYVDFCYNEYGITVAMIADESQAYKTYYDTLAVPENFKYNTYNNEWQATNNILEIEEQRPYAPEQPLGLLSYEDATNIQKDYNGAGQYPNVVLFQRVACTRKFGADEHLRYLPCYEAFATENSAYILGIIEDANNLFDSGEGSIEYVAYHTTSLDVNKKDITETAIHAGTYDTQWVFEGNYTGTVSVFSFVINKTDLVVDEEALTQTKAYDGKASQIINQIGRLDILHRYNISTSYSRRTYYSLLSALKPNAAVSCQVFKKDAQGAFVAVPGNEAKTVGEYKLVYTLAEGNAANDFRMVTEDDKGNRTEIQSTTVYLTITPATVYPYMDVVGVLHGDKLADILGKLTAPVLNGASTDIADVMTFDFAKAFIENQDGEKLLATDFVDCDAFDYYTLYIPVALADKENYVLDSEKFVVVEELTYLPVRFSVGKREIDITWKVVDAAKAIYNGKSQLGNITASFKGVDGKDHALNVVCSVGEMIHAGTYKVYAMLSAEDAKYYTLPLISDTSYTVKPLVVTPEFAIKNSQVPNIIYGTECAIDYFYNMYNLKFSGALPEDADLDTIAYDEQTARFGFDVQFIALEDGDSIRYYEEEDWGVINAGKVIGVVTITSKTVDYVIASGADTLRYEFTVEPRELDGTAILMDGDAQYFYNGNAQKAVYSIIDAYLSDKNLKETRDYTVEYANNVNVGTATLKITFVRNYKGYAEKTFEIQPRKLIVNNDITVFDVSYSTKAEDMKSVPVVRDAGIVLVEGKDYTLSYSNCTGIGTATINITYINNYEGSGSVQYKILPKNVINPTISVSTVVYTGTALTPAVTVKDGSDTLNAGVDYTVSYVNNIEAGTAQAIISFTGNYTGTAQKNFTITGKKLTPTIDVEDAVYNGEKQTPLPTVKDGAILLVKDKDYTLSYENNQDAGVATVKVTFIGNYAGTESKDFTISKKTLTLTKDNVTLEGGVYCGEEIKPVPTIKDQALTLESTDYVLTYSNNINAGKATMTVSPARNSNYTFEAFDVEFNIGKKIMTDDSVSVPDVTYNGNKQTPAVTVKDGDKTLKQDTDYTVEYSNNVNIGTAHVTVTFMGNYEGTVSKDFKIGVIKNPNETIIVSDCVYNGNEQTPAVIVKDGTKVLTEDTDYTVSYTDNVNAGTAMVVITYKGNYSGYGYQNFTIAKASVTAKVTVSGGTYTGSAVTPTPVVTVDGKTLPSSQYVVSYRNNVNTGAAYVVVAPAAAGNYTFTTVEIPFAIAAKSVSEAKVTVSDVTFNGNAQTPAVTVKDGDKVLAEGTDYTVFFENNVNAGTAKVKVTFKGNYTGTAEGSFTIEKASYSAADLSGITFADKTVVYNGQNYMINVGGTLPAGVTVSYDTTGYTEVGTYTITANFTVDANHEPISSMSAVLTIRTATMDNGDKKQDPTSPEPEKKTPEVIVEFEEGFSEDLILQVEVIATTEVKGKEDSGELLIDYQENLERNEEISRIYEVKLVLIDSEGKSKEIQVSDLAEGATILVKMEIPEELRGAGKLVRVLHVHAADDIAVLIPAAEGTSKDDLKVGEYIVEGDYLVTRIDRLSEFAFICEKDNCTTHWFMVGELVVFIIAAVLIWVISKKKKMNLAVIIACVIYTAAFVATAFFGNCTVCTVMIAVCSLALILVVVRFLTGKGSGKTEPRNGAETIEKSKDAE